MSFRDPSRFRASRCCETGSSLIIVLAFLLVIGVAAAALVGLAFTGSKTVQVYREDRVMRYNADSVLQLSILRLQRNPLMATDATSSGSPLLDSACGLNYPLQDFTAEGARPTFTAGSFLTVTCGPTTANDASGPWGAQSGSGGIDTDGGQRPRDVTISVWCQGPARPPVHGLVTCNGTGTSRLMARARVRFEIDYDAADQVNGRAIIPKVLTWYLRG